MINNIKRVQEKHYFSTHRLNIIFPSYVKIFVRIDQNVLPPRRFYLRQQASFAGEWSCAPRSATAYATASARPSSYKLGHNSPPSLTLIWPSCPSTGDTCWSLETPHRLSTLTRYTPDQTQALKWTSSSCYSHNPWFPHPSPSVPPMFSAWRNSACLCWSAPPSKPWRRTRGALGFDHCTYLYPPHSLWSSFSRSTFAKKSTYQKGIMGMGSF